MSLVYLPLYKVADTPFSFQGDVSQKKNNVKDEMTGTLQASYILSHMLCEMFFSSALYKYFCNQHWQQSRAICLSFLPVPSRIISRCNCSAHYYAEVNSSRPNCILLFWWCRITQNEISQQTWDVGPTLVYCWANIVDGGPTVNHCWANVSCLLGLLLADYSKWFSWHFASTIFHSQLTITQISKKTGGIGINLGSILDWYPAMNNPQP